MFLFPFHPIPFNPLGWDLNVFISHSNTSTPVGTTILQQSALECLRSSHTFGSFNHKNFFRENKICKIQRNEGERWFWESTSRQYTKNYQWQQMFPHWQPLLYYNSSIILHCNSWNTLHVEHGKDKNRGSNETILKLSTRSPHWRRLKHLIGHLSINHPSRHHDSHVLVHSMGKWMQANLLSVEENAELCTGT